MGVSFYLSTVSDAALTGLVETSADPDAAYDATRVASQGSYPGRSYTGFGLWREALAQIEGFDLNTMRGFGGEVEWPTWRGEPSLTPLLNHSDCDGDLSPTECRAVAERMRSLDLSMLESYDRTFTEEFLALLERAAEESLYVHFS